MRDLIRIVENAEQAQPLTNEQVRAFADTVEKELGLDSFDAFLIGGGDIRLNMIKVAKDSRKQGIGTAAMNRLCGFADQHASRIVLSPATTDRHVGTTSRTRLIAFYRRFGFRENKGRRKDFSVSESMIRDPA